MLFCLLVAIADTYVITDPVTEDGKGLEGVADDASAGVGDIAPRVGIVLQNFGRRLKIAVKTKQGESLTDDDVWEYGFSGDTVGLITKILDNVVDNLPSVAGKVLRAVTGVIKVIMGNMATGKYAGKEGTSNARDVLIAIAEDIESAGDDVFMKGVPLTGGVSAEGALTTEESDFIDLLVGALIN